MRVAGKSVSVIRSGEEHTLRQHLCDQFLCSERREIMFSFEQAELGVYNDVFVALFANVLDLSASTTDILCERDRLLRRIFQDNHSGPGCLGNSRLVR